MIRAIKWRYRDFLFNLKILKPASLLKYYAALLSGQKHVQIEVKGVDHKFLIRTNNKIDRNVLEYVFFQQYHLPPKEFLLRENPVIVDLGSNVGCTLVDFKMRYPGATVYGYEMHPENFEMAKVNTKDLKAVHVYNKAVWTERGSVTFATKNLTDAFAIDKHAKGGDGAINIPSVSIADIIRDNNLDTVDFIKMDIEGAEVEIFDSNNLDWLNNVSSMNIEFHNIPDAKLNKYIDLLERFHFQVYKSPHHWLSLLAYKN